jgi:hypothetical protein
VLHRFSSSRDFEEQRAKAKEVPRTGRQHCGAALLSSIIAAVVDLQTWHDERRARYHCSHVLMWLACLALVLAQVSPSVAMQQAAAIEGDRLSGFVLPVEPLAADVHISALRCQAWQV